MRLRAHVARPSLGRCVQEEKYAKILFRAGCVIEFDSVHIPLESRVVSSWPAQLMHASLQWSLSHVFTDRMA